MKAPPAEELAQSLVPRLLKAAMTLSVFRAELQALSRLTVEEARGLSHVVLRELGRTVSVEDLPLLDGYLTHWPGLLARRLALVGLKNVRLCPASLRTLLLPRIPGLLPGALVPGGDLAVGYWLGGGGAGDVYQGRYDVAEADPLTLKVAQGPLGAHFVRIEATLLRQLAVRGVVRGVPKFHSLTTRDRMPVLVTYHIPGYTLEEVLRYGRDVAAFTPETVQRLLLTLACILEPVHAHGLVHRDLKPGNLLFSRRRSGKFGLHVIDWGLAGPVGGLPPEEWGLGHATIVTMAELLQYGKTRFFASLQQRGGEFCQRCDDVYSIGVLAIGTLTGDFHTPIQHRDWQAQVCSRGAEEWFIHLLARCVADDRNDRPADASVLRACLEARQVVERPGQRPGSARRNVARRTLKASSPEKTRCAVLPSTLIHLAGKSPCSPGPTSHFGVKYAVLHGPHGSGAS
jgi:serine/threonine protein kinase